MKAAIYTRVSSDPKATQRSVTEQESECRAVCEREGWEVARVFCDNDRSASRYAKADRPGYAALLACIESGAVDVLVTWEASRAQRDLSAYVVLRDACERAGVRWSYSGKLTDMSDAGDRFTSGLDALLSERESEVSRERVLRAVRANAVAGKPHGRIPYGYKREYDQTTGALIRQVVREDQAEVIRECARRFISGETPYAIGRDLDARGIRPPMPYKIVDGERIDDPTVRWTLSQIRTMLTKPTYIAKRVHRGEIVGDADWPPILDVETFNRCQVRFADPKRKTSNEHAVKFLLSGLMSCGVCGARIKVGRPRGSDSYICAERFCVARSVHKVDAFITEVILARLERPDALALFADDATDQTELLAKIADTRSRLDDFYESAASGELSAAGLARVESRLIPELEALQRSVAVRTAPTSLYDLAEKPRVIWPGLSLHQQRECIRALAEIQVLRSKRGARELDPNSLRVIWLGESSAESLAG